MRVFCPTSNNYVQYAEITAALFDKYYPGHPPVDVCHHERKPNIHRPGFTLIDQGRQESCNGYIGQMIDYLRRPCDDPLTLFLLDDYGLCAPVNKTAIAIGESLMQKHRLLGFHLTWQPTKMEPFPGESPDVAIVPKWDWAVNLQMAIYNRSLLLTVLIGIERRCDPLDFERSATNWFHAFLYESGYRMAGWNCPQPPKPSSYVDSVDKSGWATPYHNLSHRRHFEEPHREFLRSEGLLHLLGEKNG